MNIEEEKLPKTINQSFEKAYRLNQTPDFSSGSNFRNDELIHRSMHFGAPLKSLVSQSDDYQYIDLPAEKLSISQFTSFGGI
jgi:hypothetical protein